MVGFPRSAVYLAAMTASAAARAARSKPPAERVDDAPPSRRRPRCRRSGMEDRADARRLRFGIRGARCVRRDRSAARLSGEPPQPGDFVRTAFPQHENPARPAPRHIGYVVATVADAVGRMAFVAYTTSRLWDGPLPPWVRTFDRMRAAPLGQSRPFVLDARRLAALHISALFKRGSALVERLGLGGRGDAPASTGGRMGEAEPMLDTLDPHPGAV